jgi:hypothetical protein
VYNELDDLTNAVNFLSRYVNGESMIGAAEVVTIASVLVRRARGALLDMSHAPAAPPSSP